MSKIDTIKRGARLLLGIIIVMVITGVAGTWMMIGHHPKEMGMAIAVLAGLTLLFVLLRPKSSRTTPKWSNPDQQPMKSQPAPVLMRYKNKPFDFVKYDPTAPDPSGDAWVGIPAT